MKPGVGMPSALKRFFHEPILRRGGASRPGCAGTRAASRSGWRQARSRSRRWQGRCRRRTARQGVRIVPGRHAQRCGLPGTGVGRGIEQRKAQPQRQPASAIMRASWRPPRMPTVEAVPAWVMSAPDPGARAPAVCAARNASSASRTRASPAARSAAANSAALTAPARPMAKVATGTPAGICTMDSSESIR